MKILHITPYYEPDFQMGGVVRSSSVLCRGLASLGHDVTVFTSTGSNKNNLTHFGKPQNVGGVEVIQFRDFLNGWIPSLQLFLSTRQIRKYDIIHIAAFWSLFADPIQKYACKNHLPYIVSPRGSFSSLFNPFLYTTKNRYVYWHIIHRNIQCASALHFTSELEWNETIRLNLRSPSFIIPNPVPWENFSALPNRLIARSELKIPNDVPVILYLGRLDRRKGLDVLINGFAKAQKDIGKMILILAGPDFGEENKLRDLVNSKNMKESVIFTGIVGKEDIRRLFSCADLVALTSHAGENFGNAAAEAMAAGLPVLVSNETGIAADIKSLGAGAVVSVDSREIGNTLVNLMQDREKLKNMGIRGQEGVKNLYDSKKVAEKMALAYADVLNQTRSEKINWKSGHMD